MRAAIVVLGTGPAFAAAAQPAPPLPAYVPPPSAAPLAPLAGDAAPDDQPTGTVRASSTESSNSSAADTRSNIAPVLPTPPAGGQTEAEYLAAAREALRAGQTGAAQEALERAESRALDRDIAPSEGGQPIEDPAIEGIRAARKALSVGDSRGAQDALARARPGQ